MISTYRISKRTVATVRQSIETSSCAWVARNVRHVGDGGLDGRTRYVSTVDLATVMPSLPRSPRMRGEPHVGFAADIVRISSPDFLGDGRPATQALAAYARPVVSEACALPGDHRPWLHDHQSRLPLGPSSRQPRPQETVGWSELRASPGSLVEGKLVAQREDFGLQRQARAEGGSDAF